MPVFNVRLSDEEYAALERLAGDGTKTALVRRWIREGGVTRPPFSGTAVGVNEDLVPVWVGGPRPSFLAAPDDDCAVCHHDRQMYHLAGVCTCPTGPRTRCGCGAFVDAGSPF